MSEDDRSSPEMLGLLREVRDNSTNIFEILDLEDHEKRLTRYLAWLLNPDASHDADTIFLESFLACFELELNGQNVDIRYLETFDTADYGQKEVDIVIETEIQVIGVEIKTTHTEHRRKFEEEAATLEEYGHENEKGIVEMLYLPHLESEKRKAEFADRVATWGAVLAALNDHRGELKTPHEIALFDDFRTNIEDHVIKKNVSFSKKTEFYLKYKDYLKDFEIDVGPDSFRNDRKEIYNHLWNWYTENYETWNGQFNRSRKFSKNTRYVRLYKDSWHLSEENSGRPEITLEIQGTENRLSWYDGYGPEGEYRPTAPHFEMTVALNDDSEDQTRRTQYLDYLGEEERDALENAGFRHIGEWLEELGSEASYNRFHMFSKIVKIDFDRPNHTVEGLKNGLGAFVALEDSIDNFASNYQP
ncbi:PD-(D/E)XK nuclease family protein [Halosolutus amylolyticus]|uniref:PD-(D/E)XK nuclease family protein n=1 Tax=Halosolutus amylolyticus TaxID=2932267 RepID=A0ABD5PIX1_9EURY|nr:PD-(D/E)XK nuclease family protein [Halosolutus amylolyticus]